jgi:lipopolysaccharide transport system ATP-binding protein
MEPIIEIKNIGKRYSLPILSKEGSTLRDVISTTANNLWRKLGKRDVKNSHDFWALKDISLTLQKGDTLGIVGRNGSGKSTTPTEGSVVLRGRVTSLLEVGTGFHMELSGRENIFLNATLLGMKWSVIKECFENIVDYSGVREFIDVPVKHYSSGMFLRLAFSIAIHADPEILILDEVISVGDAEFKEKSFKTLQDLIAKNSTTVIYVNHDLASIQKTARRIIILDKGKIIADGATKDMVERYQAMIK